MEGLTRESLRPLLDLQRVDSALDRLGQRKADLPEQRAVDDLTTRLEEARTTAAERETTFGSVARDQAKLEAEVAVIEDKISHESNRLYGGEISNPKELSSIQAEIDGLRRRKAHIEDQLLDLMESRESAEAELNQIRTTVGTLESEIEEAKARRDAASVEIARDLQDYGGQREALVAQFPEDLLALYNDLRSKKNGVGVAALESGVCKGCNVALSPVALDAIRRSSDPVVRCENCRRLLVVP
jgi:hypothetical protein